MNLTHGNLMVKYRRMALADRRKLVDAAEKSVIEDLERNGRRFRGWSNHGQALEAAIDAVMREHLRIANLILTTSGEA